MKELVLLLPEIFLAVTLVGILAGEVTYHGERTRLIAATALLGLAGALIQSILTYRYGASQILNHAVSIDGLSLYFKIFFIVLAGYAIVASLHSREIDDGARSEYMALVIACTLAMSLVAAASDLLLAFVSLQCLNVLSYFLSAYGKQSFRSTEAAIKQLVFGAVAGALLLYGMALLFVSTHSLNIYEMHRTLAATPLGRETGLVAFVLIFLALAAQIAAFPMHLWAPDVLEGAPTPVSSFLSVGSRTAGFALGLRLLFVIFAEQAKAPGQYQVLGELDWTPIVALISGLSIAAGSLLAYRQTGAKRMLAYLLIAESGFLLLGVLVLDEVGIAALLYNLAVDMFALTGAYFTLGYLIDQVRSDRLEDLRGVMGRAVPECVALVLFLVCLVGLPPLPGFIGKFALLGAAIRHQWHFLAVVGYLAMALSTAAVARLAFSLIGEFPKSVGQPLPARVSQRVFLAALLAPMALVGLFAEQVLGWAGQSLRFILW
jgi:NADH-quinone oxidoreductase subunit N